MAAIELCITFRYQMGVQCSCHCAIIGGFEIISTRFRYRYLFRQLGGKTTNSFSRFKSEPRDFWYECTDKLIMYYFNGMIYLISLWKINKLVCNSSVNLDFKALLVQVQAKFYFKHKRSFIFKHNLCLFFLDHLPGRNTSSSALWNSSTSTHAYTWITRTENTTSLIEFHRKQFEKNTEILQPQQQKQRNAEHFQYEES